MPIQPGVTLAEPAGLPGRWQVWSQTDDGPGAHAIVPASDEARETGLKYAVVRVTNRAGQHKPELTVLRTDPTKPEYVKR